MSLVGRYNAYNVSQVMLFNVWSYKAVSLHLENEVSFDTIVKLVYLHPFRVIRVIKTATSASFLSYEYFLVTQTPDLSLSPITKETFHGVNVD